MRTGLWTGSALLALFTALILVEQTQDHLLYRAYRHRLGRRLPGKERQSERPFCANRQLKDFETCCPTCGKSIS